MSISLTTPKGKPDIENLPHSGLGIPFDVLGDNLKQRIVVLHECGYQQSSGQWNYSAVYSPFWRLLRNPEPGLFIVHNGRTVELSPDRLVLTPPHCLLDFHTRKPAPQFWLHFSFHKRPAVTEPIVLQPMDTELCLIRDLQAVIESAPAGTTPERAQLLGTALAQAALSRVDAPWMQSIPPNLENLQRHIAVHFSEDLSNPTLARLAGTSLAGLARLFQRYLGTSPARYITEVRVREAASLLRGSGLTIEEIAEQTGFPNRFHFSRIFKKMTRYSPADFRSKFRLPAQNP